MHNRTKRGQYLHTVREAHHLNDSTGARAHTHASRAVTPLHSDTAPHRHVAPSFLAKKLGAAAPFFSQRGAPARRVVDDPSHGQFVLPITLPPSRTHRAAIGALSPVPKTKRLRGRARARKSKRTRATSLAGRRSGFPAPIQSSKPHHHQTQTKPLAAYPSFCIFFLS